MSCIEKDWPFNIPPDQRIDICSPLVEGPDGPECYSQPALRGDLPDDPLGFTPTRKEK